MANLFVEFKGNGVIKTWSKQYSFECFIVPRDSVSTAIPDIKTKMGVYFLVNTSEGKIDQKGKPIKRNLYIGKTSKGMVRFFSHKSKKEFWNKLFFFTANKQYFDEDTILGLENLLITKYKESNLYLMDQEGSEKDIDEDCEFFGDQIIGIMDFYGYSLEAMESNDSVPEYTSEKEAVSNAKKTSNLWQVFDDKIKKIDPAHIRADQMKLYTAYKFENKNLCAVCVRSYGLEIELYINLKDIQTPDSGAFDITFRRRGKKESAIKVENEQQLEKAISVVKEIIAKF